MPMSQMWSYSRTHIKNLMP
ncbi:hypothetical protein F383_25422 [Gossypium arboreum]|uniref:Uncharacterized protein n=1 Tax=Gossypium arboreum TaxID=29729 RepID=A0A0B0P795_GOSAR|nr:hypothetical protein F383_25422 [Gossypium arboreum]